MTELYRAIELPSDEPVQYVGCYVLKWGRVSEPSVGFVPVDEEIDILTEALHDIATSLMPDAIEYANWAANHARAALAKARGERGE